MVVRHRVLFTKPDRTVGIYRPMQWVFRMMDTGRYWEEMPHGFLDQQIERFVGDGRKPDAVRRYVHAMQWGGKNENEVWDILRDHDTGHCGTGHDYVLFRDLPDRWFRDAWRRSPNGGPIGVDLEAARDLQWSFIQYAIAEEEQRRKMALRRWRSRVQVDLDVVESSIMRAADVDALRKVWPVDLPVPPVLARAPRTTIN